MSTYSLQQYRSEATGEPFVLQVDDDHTITVPRPTTDVVLDIEEATTSRQILTLLCGDVAEEFFKAIGSEDAVVLNAISKDMKKHFGLGE